MDRQELDARLDDLQRKLPALLDDYADEEDFWAAFGEEADPLVDGAVLPEDATHVEVRIEAMLAEAGVER
ncbi:hypothetical protein QFW77_15255 [Luteimonas sp. RD2P54]|uniref:Uncharacterized protein n=1 Tax=Luteimonas endophytica TaxID=3042023 RepID=A0ABT6JCJ4_9GAMM|nr:hypothetical protein [Luteimonas endophytica]MDH5824332.1 hypothetical protein [Luteimonas endophytica]